MHLQLLFNITTPVVNIWSENSRLWVSSSMSQKEKHYKYEMNKRDRKVKTWLQACMHRTMEYIDLFSRWVLYKLPSYHCVHRAFWNRVARTVWNTSHSSVGQHHERQIHSKKRHNPVLNRHPAKSLEKCTDWSHQNLKTTSPTAASNKVLCGWMSYENISSAQCVRVCKAVSFHWSWVRKQS